MRFGKCKSQCCHHPDQLLSSSWCIQEDWVLCRVFYKNREIVAKPSMGSCYDDTGSSSLPALMDSYITFDQTHPNLDEHEQVPCFSIFSQNQINPIFPHITQMEQDISTKSTSSFGLMTAPLDPFSCDNKVIKAVLDHLTRMESNPNIKGSPSMGEGSSESYLSEVGMPNIWNNY